MYVSSDCSCGGDHPEHVPGLNGTDCVAQGLISEGSKFRVLLQSVAGTLNCQFAPRQLNKSCVGQH